MPRFSAGIGCRNSSTGFERILEANPASADQLVGVSVTYADLSLFQLVEGLRFAFPLASEREVGEVAAREGTAQSSGGTAPTEGVSGERTARTIQGDRHLPPLSELDG